MRTFCSLVTCVVLSSCTSGPAFVDPDDGPGLCDNIRRWRAEMTCSGYPSANRWVYFRVPDRLAAQFSNAVDGVVVVPVDSGPLTGQLITGGISADDCRVSFAWDYHDLVTDERVSLELSVTPSTDSAVREAPGTGNVRSATSPRAQCAVIATRVLDY